MRMKLVSAETYRMPFIPKIRYCSLTSFDAQVKMLKIDGENDIILIHHFAKSKNSILFFATRQCDPQNIFIVKQIDTKRTPHRHGEFTVRAIREIGITRKINGCLNVISSDNAYFDKNHDLFFLQMPYYTGGAFLPYLRAFNSCFNDFNSDQSDRRRAELIFKAQLFSMFSAVSQCHNNNIFHSDIKPENVLVGDDGLPALADFGSAGYSDYLKYPDHPEAAFLKSFHGTYQYCARDLARFTLNMTNKKEEDLSLINSTIDTDPLAYILCLGYLGVFPYQIKNGTLTLKTNDDFLKIDDETYTKTDLLKLSADYKLNIPKPTDSKSWQHLFFMLINEKVSVDNALNHGWFDDVRGDDGKLKDDLDLAQILRTSTLNTFECFKEKITDMASAAQKPQKTANYTHSYQECTII